MNTDYIIAKAVTEGNTISITFEHFFPDTYEAKVFERLSYLPNTVVSENTVIVPICDFEELADKQPQYREFIEFI